MLGKKTIREKSEKEKGKIVLYIFFFTLDSACCFAVNLVQHTWQ